MKKVFTLAAVAVTMVMGLASCQNDSPSSFNAAPQIQTKNQSATPSTNNNQKSYTYNLTLSDDILAIFDVQLTVSGGSESKTFKSADFSNATSIVDSWIHVNDSGKAIAPYTVKADNVSVKATFTLKSNWKEVLDGMNKKEYNFHYKKGSSVGGGVQDANKCTETYLKGFAANLSKTLTD